MNHELGMTKNRPNMPNQPILSMSVKKPWRFGQTILNQAWLLRRHLMMLFMSQLLPCQVVIS